MLRGGHSGSRETECAAVLHPPKRRETGVEQREVCKEGDRERERGVARGVYRIGNIEKCRQPNLLDIYNGQTGQLVTANLPTCNAAQAHRTKSQKELEAHATLCTPPAFPLAPSPHATQRDAHVGLPEVLATSRNERQLPVEASL